MTAAVILTVSSLLLFAYVFDLTSSKTKIPSVVLLLFLGWIVRYLSEVFKFKIPYLVPLLPILGTLGLILIVLEGSLELDFDKSKESVLKKSLFLSLMPMIVSAFSVSFLFYYFGDFSFKNTLVNSIPICVISSAIAIPSVKSLSYLNKEFIIYESSLSDIFGVLFFNFIVFNNSIGIFSFGNFIFQVLTIVILSVVSIVGLSLLLHKIDHHIKFGPIILIVILIYEILKIYHLPSLIFIFLFGLFLGNLDKLKKLKWIEKLKPEELTSEIVKFKEITFEAAFLVRALFFLLFGYLIKTSEIFNPDTVLWAVAIVIIIFTVRYLHLKIIALPINPLLFIAPRGLITILLYLAIPSSQTIPIMNNSLIIQVIILTSLIMMVGIMMQKNKK